MSLVTRDEGQKEDQGKRCPGYWRPNQTAPPAVLPGVTGLAARWRGQGVPLDLKRAPNSAVSPPRSPRPQPATPLHPRFLLPLPGGLPGVAQSMSPSRAEKWRNLLSFSSFSRNYTARGLLARLMSPLLNSILQCCSTTYILMDACLPKWRVTFILV